MYDTVMPDDYPNPIEELDYTLGIISEQLDTIIDILEHQFGSPPDSAAELAQHEAYLDAFHRGEEATC